MATVNVSNAQQLIAALSVANAGDTILLAAGNYGSVQLKRLDFPGNVTIASADPANQALIEQLLLDEVQNLTVTGIEFGRALNAGESHATSFISVYDSSNIVFDGVHVHGSLDGNPQNDGYGMDVRNSSGIDILNSEFQQVGRGIKFLTTTDINVVNNHIHDVRTDGLNFFEVKNVNLDKNYLHGFYPAEGDHADAIQFMTKGATVPSTDIRITNNVIMQGVGVAAQGIFLKDETTVLPYENVLIANNLVYMNMYNGITVARGTGIEIIGNTVLSENTDNIKARIWLDYVDGAKVENNLADIFLNLNGANVADLANIFLYGDYDIGASCEANNAGERYHWYSSTGWIMWNGQVSALTGGTTICIYDGSPAGPKDAPDWGVLWRFAARHRVTLFGAGAAFYANCMKAGLRLADCGDLSRVRALGSTGSPLAEDVQRWGTAQFAALSAPGTPDIWWNNISGGTDFCVAVIGGHPELPLQPGRMQCRHLGCAVEAWDEEGRAVTGEVGELVITRPMPSMPLYLWGDEDNKRYLSSYFDTYPGVWRHGDWLSIGEDGSCVIYGRSDATINRHGLRMGTSELYAAVEALPEVLDSMVIDLEYLGRPSWMALFVVLRPGHALDAAMDTKLREAIKQRLSPRFVPDAIVAAPEIPRTLSGKKQEVPIKKLFLGQPLERVVNRDAMANPQCLAWYAEQAARRASEGAV